MTHTHTAPDPRWRILDDIAEARETWGLKDRTLAVLRALLSFLPRGERLRLTVFPSNRTLCGRLMGMPESTLRRHLARLIEAGLIARVDSPNRKRYRVGQGLAFGFDLSAVFALGQEARARAAAAREAAEERAVLRARLRMTLARAALPKAAHAHWLRLLRRKLCAGALRRALSDLSACLPPDADASAAQNGRHIHPQTEPEPRAEAVAMDAVAAVAGMAEKRIGTARELREAGERVAAMLAVPRAWDEARRAHGEGWAVMALAYLAPRMARLRAPDRYLRALVKRSGQGRFDLVAALGRDGHGALA